MAALQNRRVTRRSFACAAVVLLVAGNAPAATPRDDFPLGQSTRSGAVCKAVRDFDDPLGAGTGRRTWQVTCRGWSQTLGHVYYFRSGAEAGLAAWRKTLAGRADCDFTQKVAASAVVGASTFACKTKSNGASYVVFEAHGGGAIAAEGYGPVADVLAPAVKVVQGRMKPPAETSQQSANLGDALAGQVENLAAITEASGNSAEKQKESAYREAQLWRFGPAASRFNQLAAGSVEGLAATDQAEAYLNVALNASNTGSYDEADAYFKAAEPLVAEAKVGWLRALELNNRAAHARNERKFQEAIDFARQAVLLRRSTSEPAATALVVAVGSDLRIGRAAARALNSQGKAPSLQLGAEDREAVRDAQALQIRGTSQEELKNRTEAIQSLQAAAEILRRPRGGSDVLGSAAPWLTARIQADLARLDRNAGAAPAAVRRLEAALTVYEVQDAGSLPLGHFLIELARAKAASGQDDEALADFERAFDIFRAKRGALGASADSAGAYFDILLQRIGKDPAAHPAEVARFFRSSEALVGESTAAASLQFAERLTAEGNASANISRSRDATLRAIDDKQEELRRLQRSGGYVGEDKAKIDRELQALLKVAQDLEQQLFAADPRYASALKTSVGAQELQASLDDGEAYLKVLLLANRGYGLLITKHEVRPYGIELNRTKARQMAAKLRLPFDQVSSGRLGRYDVLLAHQAYETLLGPVEPQLAGVKRLIYQPDPTLVGVPIGALVVTDDSAQVMRHNLEDAIRNKTVLSYKGVGWLAARFDTSVSVSTAAFVGTRKSHDTKAPKPFLGFGNPINTAERHPFSSVVAPASSIKMAGGVDFCASLREALIGLPALPETATEVEVIAKVVGAPGSVILGSDFTDERIKRDGGTPGILDQYRVLYFATHGLLPQANGCLQPALVTSQGAAGSDSLLDIREIPNLWLDADLVVLSACDTGAGLDGSGGAELGGLVSTFTYAGARNLLVSNWKVDSKATELLMTNVFTSKASTQGAALAEAEKAFMGRSDAYSHPFYWAAFSIVGDSRRAQPRM
jgi:CHAT domain-containing protein